MLTAASGRYANTVTLTYDGAGRKWTEGLTISGQTYTTTTTYDTAGQLTGYTYPDGTSVGRSYTDRGQLYQLTHASATIDTRTYDDGGRMTASTYNNGVSESRSYNTDNTLASISYTGAAIGTYSYGWDDNKNKTSESISGTLSGYGFAVGGSGYDAEDRLVNWDRSDTNLSQSWNLSLVGDWNSITENGTAQSRTHGPTHEMLTAGGQSVTHDVKGNMTLIPAVLRPSATSLALSWDFDNRLSTADVDNDSTVDVTYKWDALGRRVYRDDGTTATVYVQSGQQTIADYTASTAASSPKYRYVYASYIDEPVLRYEPAASQSRYYHRNQQYSIIALTDGVGAIQERYAYSAYGELTVLDGSGTVTTTDNRYTYTGREWDGALELFHFRARMYDSVAGRFLGRDPIGFDGSPWNYYEYNYSDPLYWLDPLGDSPQGDGDDSAGGSEHETNQSESNRETHEEGQARKQRDRGGEKGDDRRDVPRRRPKGHKGPWPPNAAPAPPLTPPIPVAEWIESGVKCLKGWFDNIEMKRRTIIWPTPARLGEDPFPNTAFGPSDGFAYRATEPDRVWASYSVL